MWLRTAAAIVLAVLVSSLYFGCSPDTRYKVLSFFFDGVLRPGEEPPPKKVRGPWSVTEEPGGTGGAERLAVQQPESARPAVVILSEHAPYRNRECFSCHEVESSLVALKGGPGVCRKCHAQYVDPPPAEWVHGPTALGMCDYCHESHKSQYPSLLTRPPRDLCRRCHNEPELLERPYHKAAGDVACSACHDPHMAGNRLLLVDSGSYKRRRVDRRPGVEHAPWRERKCTLCHLPEQSNAMVANLDAVCLSCHAKVLEGAPPKKLHKAVEEKHCVVCHAPHRSPLPALVRTNAEQMCYACHKVEETRKPGHPPVERADCLLCHKGHASEREHLLRSDIVWPPAPVADLVHSSPAAGPAPDVKTGGGTAGPGP